MMTDPIADFLARIRNSMMIKRKQVKVLDSKIVRHMAECLQKHGYIEGFEIEKEKVGSSILVRLKYDSTGAPIIDGMKRVSKPGLRIYRCAKDLPKVLGGLGMAIVSTSKGIMNCQEAREKKVGGEVLCYVW